MLTHPTTDTAQMAPPQADLAKPVRMTFLSHCHYAISDRAAGQLAKASPGNDGRLPRHGYERDVIANGSRWTLSRTTISRILDPLPWRNHKRGWVWTLRPAVELPTYL